MPLWCHSSSFFKIEENYHLELLVKQFGTSLIKIGPKLRILESLTDRETYRQIDRERERWTDTHIYSQTHSQGLSRENIFNPEIAEHKNILLQYRTKSFNLKSKRLLFDNMDKNGHFWPFELSGTASYFQKRKRFSNFKSINPTKAITIKFYIFRSTSGVY